MVVGWVTDVTTFVTIKVTIDDFESVIYTFKYLVVIKEVFTPYCYLLNPSKESWLLTKADFACSVVCFKQKARCLSRYLVKAGKTDC